MLEIVKIVSYVTRKPINFEPFMNKTTLERIQHIQELRREVFSNFRNLI